MTENETRGSEDEKWTDSFAPVSCEFLGGCNTLLSLLHSLCQSRMAQSLPPSSLMQQKGRRKHRESFTAFLSLWFLLKRETVFDNTTQSSSLFESLSFSSLFVSGVTERFKRIRQSKKRVKVQRRNLVNLNVFQILVKGKTVLLLPLSVDSSQMIFDSSFFGKEGKIVYYENQQKVNNNGDWHKSSWTQTGFHFFPKTTRKRDRWQRRCLFLFSCSSVIKFRDWNDTFVFLSVASLATFFVESWHSSPAKNFSHGDGNIDWQEKKLSAKEWLLRKKWIQEKLWKNIRGSSTKTCPQRTLEDWLQKQNLKKKWKGKHSFFKRQLDWLHRT